jgi:ABC-type multidrug transport system ATPase subunit/ABC-type multidrug transport system permease subunit
VERVITLGRSASNDLVVNDSSVSARHARIVLDSEGAWLEDVGSKNGTFIRDEAISRARLHRGDSVRLGEATVPFDEIERVLRPEPASSREAAQTIRLVPGVPLVFGRHPSCQVRLDSPRASARHASVSMEGGRMVVRDLGSTNGTFVHGTRITGPTVVAPGTPITIAGSRFVLEGDQRSLRSFDLAAEDSLEALQLVFAVKEKLLLENVSMVAQPGEFIAIIGPSGAGKSTLLALLNGSAAPTQGSVRLGGIDLHRHFDLFRGRIGYVPQDDIMHTNLTVQQALTFAARLRLPKDFSRREIEQRVAQVIGMLGLEGTEHTRIGDQHRRGISGGQRKRVNVALELMSDPTVLILDEPTSGLSSADAAGMIKLLRSLAKSGKIVLLTIHQPSMEIFSEFDAVAIVARDASTRQAGRLAWYGAAVPDSLRFFEGQGGGDRRERPHVDGLLQQLALKPVAEWVARWERSEAMQQWVARRLRRSPAPDTAHGQRRPQPKNRFIQLNTLIRRAIAVKMGDAWNTTALILQAPLIGLLIAGVFGKVLSSEPTVANWPDISAKLCTSIFLTVVAAIWFGVSATAREIVGEWPIYRRERMVGLSMLSYVSAKVILAILLASAQCALLLPIIYSLGNFTADFGLCYRLLLAAAAVGSGFGLVISAIVQSAEAAAAILPILLLPMIVLGGALVKLSDQPDFVRPLTALMPSRWGFEGLLHAEASARARLLPGAPLAPGLPPNLATGSLVLATAPPSDREIDMAERCFPRDDGRHTPGGCIDILTLMAALAFLSVGGILRVREDSGRRG